MTGPLHNPTVVNETQNAEIGVNADLGDMEWRGYQSAEIYGNTAQTTLSGKNLLNTNNPFGTHESGGIMTTWSDNVGTASGEATSTSAIVTDTVVQNLPAGTYTFSVQTAVEYNLIIALYNSGTSSWVNYTLPANTKSVQKTTDFTATQWRIGASGWSVGDDISNLKIDRPMLELGSTASDYEPYCGGIPAPNPTCPFPVNIVTGEQTVKITGKNLLDMDAFLTAGSATYTKSNNQYSITNVGNMFSLRYKLSVIAGQTYTISCLPVSQSTSNARVQIYKDGAYIGVIYAGTDNNAHDFTFTVASGSAYSLNMTYSSPFNSPILLNSFQLELGNSPSQYKTYQGQSYGINLGKNLVEEVIPETNIDSSGEIIATNQYQMNLAKVEQGKTYTMSIDGSQYVYGFFTAKPALTSVSYDGARTVASNAPTFTAPITGYVAFRTANAFNKPQLELGDKATSYASYKTPTELCKIDTYQDYIYKSGDKWYKHAEVGKVAFDGSEAWSSANSNAYFYKTLLDAIILPSSATMPPVISDYYTPANRDDLWASRVDYGVGLYDGALGRVIIRNKDCANSNALKTWLTTHNTTVYYPLATPTDTEITDSELVGQLEALLAGSLYKGTNNIFLIPSAGADGTMSLDYRIDYEKETTVVPTTPVLLDLKDGGIINACLCRQNVEITMRETVQ